MPRPPTHAVTQSAEDEPRERAMRQPDDSAGTRGDPVATGAVPCGATSEERRIAAHAPDSVVLVVDDDSAVRRLIARQLRELGWRIEAFDSARAALAWLRAPARRASADGGRRASDRVRLVVSDVDMPGMDGLTFARELRRAFPTLHVLLVSGRAAPGVRRVAVTRADGSDASDLVPSESAEASVPRSAGEGLIASLAVWVLGKPFGLEALADAVRQVLDASIGS